MGDAWQQAIVLVMMSRIRWCGATVPDTCLTHYSLLVEHIALTGTAALQITFCISGYYLSSSPFTAVGSLHQGPHSRG